MDCKILFQEQLYKSKHWQASLGALQLQYIYHVHQGLLHMQNNRVIHMYVMHMPNPMGQHYVEDIIII